MMNLGLIARADNSGLGIQTWEFYKHMKPHKTLVVDISKFNGNKQYPERYPDGIFVKGFPQHQDYLDFLNDLDVVFIAEASYGRQFYDLAREHGVKTAVQYNYEFFDWFTPGHPMPDLFIAPSTWHYEKVQRWAERVKVKHILLRCPVNRELLPPRKIKQARTFLHIAGRSAAHDRNGTEVVIEASRYLTSQAKIKIHFQGEQGLPHQMTKDIDGYRKHLLYKGNPEAVTIQQFEYENYQDVYAEGDVLVLPRRYGGNCLPMNEALSIGMPVIMTDILPNRSFLPKQWLIPAYRAGQFEPRTTINIFSSDPKDLAAQIDRFYNMVEHQMLLQNMRAIEAAEKISWANMEWKYRKVFEDLCNQ